LFHDISASHRSFQYLAYVDELVDDNWRRELLDSLQSHFRGDSATECDGLEDFLYARTIGNANHLASRLHGKAGDKHRGQALGVAA
jgi:hypothetical protein